MLLELAAASGVAQVQQSDRATLIAQANAARAAQDFKRAIAILEPARTANPNDVEILRLLGTSYAFDRRYDDAIATLIRARDLAPDDLDVRAALARAYLWSGRRGEAQVELAAIKARDPGNADAALLHRQLESPAPGKEAGDAPVRRRGAAMWSEVSGVTLASGASRTWWTIGGSAYTQIGARTSISGEVEREARQSRVDTHLQARIDQQFSPHLRGYLAVGGTPDADFREKWSVRGGVEVDVVKGVTLLADARHADYGSVAITAFEPGARVTVASIRTAVTVHMINLWDERDTHRTGWSGRIDSEVGRGILLFAGAATYPDTEAGITRRMRSVFGGVAVPVSRATTLRLTVDHDDRVNSYRRTGGTLGLQIRF
ncbi:YaiO family outer membrane beta-barrel protein [Sphingomonas lycopersici]|uniref:YaiO family outer membrane beta-barrel protein n=1 Tax=Sphingomonas lycopersici TaxID=2951807 RepID=A0AA41Z6A2_9SPHN|nr:YaiO family outer membrane beta-barrel protein [Sphingomonas lycopersici]MCW6533708.1 YaiO family outer membrane beta-barrel protein [Sphingomonas lycopersici]